MGAPLIRHVIEICRFRNPLNANNHGFALAAAALCGGKAQFATHFDAKN